MMAFMREIPAALLKSTESRVLVLFVAVLTACAFFPLALRRNFLPFDHYTMYTEKMPGGETAAGLPAGDYAEAYRKHPYLFDMEPGWFTINMPQDYFFAAKIREGKIPFWDPYTGCGQPTFGSGQFRPFNPLKAVFYVSPSFFSYSIFLFLQLILGLSGFFLWLRERGLSAEASISGAFLFTFNPWILLRLPQSDAAGYLVFPFVLLALERSAPGKFRTMIWTVLALTWMGESSHPESFLLLSGAALLGFVLKASDKRRALLFSAGAVALTSITLLPLWLPALIYYLGNQSYKSMAVMFEYPYSLKSLFFLPSDMFMLPLAAGILAVGLIERKNNFYWKFVLAVSFLFLVELPFAGHAVSGFMQKHAGFHAFYLKPLIWTAVSLLFAAGVDRILREGLPRQAAVVLTSVSIVSLGLCVYYLIALKLPAAVACGSPWIPLLFSAAGLVLVLFGNRAETSWPVTAAIILVMFPLVFPLSSGKLRWNERDLDTSALMGVPSDLTAGKRCASLFSHPAPILSPNWGQVFGIRQIEGSAAIFPDNLLRLFHNRKFPPTLLAHDYPEKTVFQQMGAEFVLVPDSEKGLDSFNSFKKILSNAGVAVYGIEGAMGRVFLAGNTVLRDPSLEISRQIMEIGGGADGCAVVEPQKKGVPVDLGYPGPEGSARIEKDLEEEVVVGVQAAGRSLLVLRDCAARGWKVEIDGVPADLLRVNGCFRGVMVNQGNHVVRFCYEASTELLSIWASLAGILFLTAGLARKKR